MKQQEMEVIFDDYSPKDRDVASKTFLAPQGK
jgi:hypothetical protein